MHVGHFVQKNIVTNKFSKPSRRSMTEIPADIIELYNAQKWLQFKYYFVKQIRRHHAVIADILNKDGSTFHRIGFELLDPKKTEGQTTGDGYVFETIWTAWQYYENLILEHYNKN